MDKDILNQLLDNAEERSKLYKETIDGIKQLTDICKEMTEQMSNIVKNYKEGVNNGKE